MAILVDSGGGAKPTKPVAPDTKLRAYLKSKYGYSDGMINAFSEDRLMRYRQEMENKPVTGRPSDIFDPRNPMHDPNALYIPGRPLDIFNPNNPMFDPNENYIPPGSRPGITQPYYPSPAAGAPTGYGGGGGVDTTAGGGGWAATSDWGGGGGGGGGTEMETAGTAEGDVYGGIEWAQLQAQITIEAAKARYNMLVQRGVEADSARNLALDYANSYLTNLLATGYTYTDPMQAWGGWGGANTPEGYSMWEQPEGPTTKAVSENAVTKDNPTEDDALLAIYKNRPDIKTFYDASEEWKSKSELERMKNWIGMTSEEAFKGKDPIQAAKDAGFLQTTEEAAAATAPKGEAQQAAYAPEIFTPEHMPTPEQGQWAIWQMRADIREKYGKDAAGKAVPWRTAMANWMAAEKVTDPVKYAVDNSYVHVAANKVKTLAREAAEHTWTMEEQEAGRREQEMKNTTSLQYAQALASQQGPADWVNYWKLVRGVGGSDVPAWMTQVQGKYNLPAWGREYGQTAPASWDQLAQQYGQAQPQAGWAGQIGTGAPQAATPNRTGQIENWQQQAGQMNPWQVSSRQWSTMLPSEKQGLAGLINSSGGWGEDWLQQMQNAFPQGQSGNTTYWR